MKNRALTLAASLSLALSLTACGGGDDEKATKAISESLMSQPESSTIKVEQKQADCVAEGMVDEIGVEKLQGYGFLDKDLKATESVDNLKMEEGDADSLAQTFVDCVDTEKLLKDEFAASGDLTEDQQKCVADVMDEDAMKKMFSLMFQGKDEEATKDLMGPILKCVTG